MYHIIKASRRYEGKGYCGASSNNISMEFLFLHDAIYHVGLLLEKNPVGWDIIDSVTKQKIIIGDANL